MLSIMSCLIMLIKSFQFKIYGKLTLATDEALTSLLEADEFAILPQLWEFIYDDSSENRKDDAHDEDIIK